MGVYKKGAKWSARINAGGEKLYLGSFDEEWQAGLAFAKCVRAAQHRKGTARMHVHRALRANAHFAIGLHNCAIPACRFVKVGLLTPARNCPPLAHRAHVEHASFKCDAGEQRKVRQLGHVVSCQPARAINTCACGAHSGRLGNEC